MWMEGTLCGGGLLSLLQHMRQTQPGSPLRPTRTDRLLGGRVSDGRWEKWGEVPYTMLLIKVQTHPMNVRVAMVLSFRLPGMRSEFLYE